MGVCTEFLSLPRTDEFSLDHTNGTPQTTLHDLKKMVDLAIRRLLSPIPSDLGKTYNLPYYGKWVLRSILESGPTPMKWEHAIAIYINGRDMIILNGVNVAVNSTTRKSLWAYVQETFTLLEGYLDDLPDQYGRPASAQTRAWCTAVHLHDRWPELKEAFAHWKRQKH